MNWTRLVGAVLCGIAGFVAADFALGFLAWFSFRLFGLQQDSSAAIAALIFLPFLAALVFGTWLGEFILHGKSKSKPLPRSLALVAALGITSVVLLGFLSALASGHR